MFNDWCAPAFVFVTAATAGAVASVGLRRIFREPCAESQNDVFRCT